MEEVQGYRPRDEKNGHSWKKRKGKDK